MFTYYTLWPWAFSSGCPPFFDIIIVPRVVDYNQFTSAFLDSCSLVASNGVFISGGSKSLNQLKSKSEMVTHAVNHFGSRPSTTVRSGKVCPPSQPVRAGGGTAVSHWSTVRESTKAVP